MAYVDSQAALEGRVRHRTPIWFILGVAGTSVCGLLSLGLDLLNGGLVPFMIAVGLALLPVPLLLAGLLFLDRLEPEPIRYLAFAFLWGAGVSILLAGVLNTMGLYFITRPVFGPGQGVYVTSTIGAPLIEETLKGLVLFGMLWFRRRELNGPTDGIIYAGIVGLGFATLENVGYYMRALESHGLAELAQTFVVRGVMSPFCHPAFTALIGLGVAHAALTQGWARLLAPACGWLGSVVLHGLWNGSSAFGLAGFAVSYTATLLVIIALIAVTVADRRRVVAVIGRFLPRYAPRGVVTPADIVMLSTLWARRRARMWARAAGGNPAQQAMSEYQQAATELAMLHRRAARGVHEPEWFAARRDALLQLMANARSSFLQRQPHPGVPPWVRAGESAFGAVPPAEPPSG